MGLIAAMLIVLTGPALLARVTGHMAWKTAARIGISSLLILTGIAHFVATDALANIIPPFIPAHNAIVYATGVLELLGAIGIWIPGLERLTGFCLILFLLAVFPANIYEALNHPPAEVRSHVLRFLAMRLPLQIFLIYWIHRATLNGTTRSFKTQTRDAPH